VTVPRPEVRVRYSICVLFVVYLILIFCTRLKHVLCVCEMVWRIKLDTDWPDIYRIMKLSRMR